MFMKMMLIKPVLLPVILHLAGYCYYALKKKSNVIDVKIQYLEEIMWKKYLK